jgi:hypothetical protein
MTARVQEFRFSDRPWRLDWLGRILYPANSQSEPRIAVYLSELKHDYAKALSNESLAEPGRNKVATVKIGQIALLRTGSVWIDGVEVPSPKLLDEVTCQLQHDQLDLVRFDGQVEIDGESTPVLPAHRYRIGGTASREVAGSWLAVAYNPKPGLRFLAIPSTALFQRCLATSPKAIRRLVYGEVDKIVDPACGFLVNKPGTYYINLFKDFRDNEATALANLKADPIAQREFKRFRNSLVIESANFDRTRSGGPTATHIKLGLPFVNPVTITVRGKYLPLDVRRGDQIAKEWGFLATEIVDLKVRLVFEQLIVDRKNNAKQGANADDPDLPFAFGPVIKNPTTVAEPVQPVTSADEPADDLEKLSLEACGGFEAIGLKLIHEQKEVQQYQAWPLVRSDGEEFSGVGTTGDPSGTGGGVAEVDVATEPTPSFPVTLEQFLETLDILAERELPFETLAVSTMHRKLGRHVVNFIRRTIKGVRSWHLACDDSRAAPRGYVIAELKRGDVWHYLLELERKGREALALAHIREHAGGRIDRRRLEWFMVDVAKANGWGAAEDYKQWVYQPIRHTPSKGAKAFAQAIASKI